MISVCITLIFIFKNARHHLLNPLISGNNHLGGQDFNQRLTKYLLDIINKRFGRSLTNKEDKQTLRLQVETVKLELTSQYTSNISMTISSFESAPLFQETVSRTIFEDLNADLFSKVLEPIKTVLNIIEMDKQEVHDIVLVGGSTRIPKIRELIRDYFNKEPNTSVEPDLAVAIGVSIQAGIIGGMWPLTVSAVERQTKVKKIHIS